MVKGCSAKGRQQIARGVLVPSSLRVHPPRPFVSVNNSHLLSRDISDSSMDEAPLFFQHLNILTTAARVPQHPFVLCIFIVCAHILVLIKLAQMLYSEVDT